MNRQIIAKELVGLAKALLAQNEVFELNDLQKKVADFIEKNPNPDDKKFHAWAEGEGLDVHKAEAAAYRLATVAVSFLLHGRANEKKFKKADADSKELAMGIKVEMEHTSSKEVAERISLDHLAEVKDYYTRLKKMEEEAGIKD